MLYVCTYSAQVYVVSPTHLQSASSSVFSSGVPSPDSWHAIAEKEFYKEERLMR
mgnify:CR=1 FL=1